MLYTAESNVSTSHEALRPRHSSVTWQSPPCPVTDRRDNLNRPGASPARHLNWPPTNSRVQLPESRRRPSAQKPPEQRENGAHQSRADEKQHHPHLSALIHDDCYHDVPGMPNILRPICAPYRLGIRHPPAVAGCSALPSFRVSPGPRFDDLVRQPHIRMNPGMKYQVSMQSPETMVAAMVSNMPEIH